MVKMVKKIESNNVNELIEVLELYKDKKVSIFGSGLPIYVHESDECIILDEVDLSDDYTCDDEAEDSTIPNIITSYGFLLNDILYNVGDFLNSVYYLDENNEKKCMNNVEIKDITAGYIEFSSNNGTKVIHISRILKQ